MDAFQAYFHLVTEYKINHNDITIVGDSAGGGLVMALLVYLRDHGYSLPEASILISVKFFFFFKKKQQTIIYLLFKNLYIALD